MFPGGGQFYNEQNIKGSILLSGAVLSSLIHLDFANKYKNPAAPKFQNKHPKKQSRKTEQPGENQRKTSEQLLKNQRIIKVFCGFGPFV